MEIPTDGAATRPGGAHRGGGGRMALLAGVALLGLAAVLPLAATLGLLPALSPAAGRLLAAGPLGLGLAGVGLAVPAVRRRPALLAGFLGAGWAILLGAFFRRPDGPAAWDGDASFFHRMAEEWPWRPDGWWRYRVLVPTAVHALPIGVNAAYHLLALASVAAAAPLLSLLLRDLGYGPAARHAGAALYLASFAPLYNSYNYALPDPAAMVVLLLAARALARGRDGELALWLAVGCVTKEVALFLVPARWLLRRGEEGDRRGLLRTALVAAPAGILFVALRALPAEAGNYAGFVTGNAWLFPWKHQPDNLARVYSPFAAGWGLLLAGALRPSAWARAGGAFAALVVASLLVTDAGRMLVYLLPFAVPAMLDGAGLGAGPGAGTGLGAAPGAGAGTGLGAAPGAGAGPGTAAAPRAGAGPLAGGIPVRSLLLVALACLSMRMWEPFLLFWRIPEGARRGAALLLLPLLLALALRARRGGGASAGP